jgi:hypothetical protein
MFIYVYIHTYIMYINCNDLTVSVTEMIVSGGKSPAISYIRSVNYPKVYPERVDIDRFITPYG